MRDGTLKIDNWAWHQEIARRCGSMGIGFRVDPDAPTASTDGKTVVVPALPAHATRDDFMIHRGSVIHECGHVIRPEAFKILEREKLKMGSPLWACMNIVEDAAQERALADAYRGDRITLAAMHAAILRRQTTKMAAMEPGDVNDEGMKLAAAFAVSLYSARDWSRDMATVYGDYVRAMDRLTPGVTALAGDLIREGYADQIRNAGPPSGAWAAARALYARLFPDKPEQENKQSAAEQAAAAKGKTKPGKMEKGEADGEPVPGRIPWNLLFHSDHSEEMGVPCESSIDWTGKPVTREGAAYFTKHTVEKVTATAGATASAALMRFPAELVQQVRVLLQSLARVKWAHEKLEGRLDKRNLTRVLMPRVGDGTFNRSVFSRQVPKMELDCAVTVLVDCSGSMAGDKYESACEAATSLYDLCGIALRVPCEVLGFTTAYNGEFDGPKYLEFKPFRESRVPRETVAARLLSFRSLRGNADGDAILFAAKRLLGRKESRRILIVLSDGAPADSVEAMNDMGSADVNLVAAIATARATPGLEVYGLGIMDSNVRRYYSPKAPVVKRVTDVPAALLEVLRDILQRKAPKC